jgi:cell cycle related kinase
MENYKILEKLNEGSSGIVYSAKHLLSDDTVALKKIRLRKIEEGLPKTAIREIITTR